jgi:hypothetical protein
LKLHYGTNDAVIGGGVHPIAYVHSKEITVRSKILAEKLENIYGLKNEQLEAEIYLQKQHSILDKLRVLPFVDRQLREQMPHWRWKIRPL